MIKNTKFLRETFLPLKSFIVLEDAGDGDFLVVDSEDNVYEFLPEDSMEVKPAGQKLFDYILARFRSI